MGVVESVVSWETRFVAPVFCHGCVRPSARCAVSNSDNIPQPPVVLIHAPAPRVVCPLGLGDLTLQYIHTHIYTDS